MGGVGGGGGVEIEGIKREGWAGGRGYQLPARTSESQVATSSDQSWRSPRSWKFSCAKHQ